MRREGISNPELRTAARTRSRDSRTALPASPTIVSPGSPNETSTSTRTGMPSTPTIDALSAVASMVTSRETRMGQVPAACLLASLLPAATGAAERRDGRLPAA